MGQHFVPRRYLRNFEVEPFDRGPSIWQLDLNERSCKLLPIVKVAQLQGFYSDATETELATAVEDPGNRAMARLVRGESISDTDRRAFAKYMGAMLKRTHKRRKMGMATLPLQIAEFLGEFRTSIGTGAANGDFAAQAAENGLKNLDTLEARWSEEIPRHFTDLLTKPMPSDRVTAGFHGCQWIALRAEGESLFLSSDDPVVMDTGSGLLGGGFVFPVAKTLAIWGDPRGPFGSLEYARPSRQLVKQINVLTVQNADRFVFSHEDAKWVFKVAERVRSC